MLCNLCNINSSDGSHFFIRARQDSSQSNKVGNTTYTTTKYQKIDEHIVHYCKHCEKAYHKKIIMYILILLSAAVVLSMPLIISENNINTGINIPIGISIICSLLAFFCFMAGIVIGPTTYDVSSLCAETTERNLKAEGQMSGFLISEAKWKELSQQNQSQ